ncbi:hypothetical protein [Azospirillum argentinense]
MGASRHAGRLSSAAKGRAGIGRAMALPPVPPLLMLSL